METASNLTLVDYQAIQRGVCKTRLYGGTRNLLIPQEGNPYFFCNFICPTTTPSLL
ncbi:hypothetical protein DPMN_017975 [Dreissena polymorpha]|uniref:Uncharacterized protein n=1 Tax=Dreissena polymorpha TaxID=45954 RepID=A0A9D4NCE9_DREPO|nr:hypothetical protein DPMN_017975 [Dreissena polymorpha]